MKGALNTPDGKRPHPHRMGKTEGNIKRQGFKRHSRHEGLAPVRYSQRPETGSGLLRANSCRTSDRSACLFPRDPGPRPPLRDPRTVGFPFRAHRLCGRRVGQIRPSVRDKKKAPALRLLRETEEPETKTRRNDTNPVFLAILSFPADRRSDRESKVAPGQADAAYGFPIVRFAAVGNDTRPPAASFEREAAQK